MLLNSHERRNDEVHKPRYKFQALPLTLVSLGEPLKLGWVSFSSFHNEIIKLPRFFFFLMDKSVQYALLTTSVATVCPPTMLLQSR